MRTFVGFLLAAGLVMAAEATSDHVRDAAARAVTLIQASQKDWYAKQSCESCHQQLMPAIAFRIAREHGIPVNETIARSDLAQAFAPSSSLDRAVQYTHIIDPSMDDGMRLLSMDAAGVKPNLATAVYARFIATRQLADGHWVTIDQRPPQSYSYITATAVSMRAIQLYGHPSLAADTNRRVERARMWLIAQKPQCTEELTFQLLGLHWSGAPARNLHVVKRELLAKQNADGGWGEMNGRPSDAYSTGEALYALHEAGNIATTDAAWARGVRFLLDTQQPDGSWHVQSRLRPPAQVSPPYFETGYPYGHDQFISAMGSSWAIIALATSLGPVHKVELPAIPEAQPRDVEPWMETVLFGSVADLRALLDKKFDPNSASKEGTTALMMAMPDVEKAKLLIEHGANVNARAKTKYSALLVAAQYPDSMPVMEYLIDQGAQVRLPKGSGAPLFNATVLSLALMAGNAEAVPMLIGKGDRLDDKFLLIGMIPTNLSAFTISFDDVPSLTAALDAGLSVEDPDAAGFTLLDSAVIANRLEIAQLLISRGANVNALDKNGMTPLLYAASIDFGDTKMIDLLLKSGASKQAKTKAGLTALQLAQKYDHTQLVKSLE